MNESRFEILKAFFRLGVFVGGCGFLLALVEPRDSPEFVISVCSTLIGAGIILGVVIMLRLSSRQET